MPLFFFSFSSFFISSGSLIIVSKTSDFLTNLSISAILFFSLSNSYSSIFLSLFKFKSLIIFSCKAITNLAAASSFCSLSISFKASLIFIIYYTIFSKENKEKVRYLSYFFEFLKVHFIYYIGVRF